METAQRGERGGRERFVGRRDLVRRLRLCGKRAGVVHGLDLQLQITKRSSSRSIAASFSSRDLPRPTAERVS